MASRLELQEILESIPGVKKAYFQPPENVKLVYPCILYEINKQKEVFADDLKYLYRKAYTITVIDRDPDSEIPDHINELPLSSFDRFYAADNLNHFVYTLYY